MGQCGAPPYALTDNEFTLLSDSDLVFIDPPHTGWSVSANEKARKRITEASKEAAKVRKRAQEAEAKLKEGTKP